MEQKRTKKRKKNTKKVKENYQLYTKEEFEKAVEYYKEKFKNEQKN